MGDGDELKGNYLCIGAGTSTLSFVDTMLSSTDKSISFIIVDKHVVGTGTSRTRLWARVIRGRLPAIRRPNAEILHHGPPPAYARGQAAVGGAEPWPQVHPARHRLRGVRAAAGL